MKKWLTDWSVDKLIIVSATLCVLAEIGLNFTTSYGHIYVLGRWYGEDGTDARLTPVGIDLFLFVFAEINLYLARKKRYVEKVKRDGKVKLRPEFRWPRWLLGAGVFGTVAANGAYGFHWGWTGALIAMGSAVLLFFTVEGGMLLMRVAAEEAEKTKGAEVKLTPEQLHQAALDIPNHVDPAIAPPWGAEPAPKPPAPGIADTQAWRGLSGIGTAPNGQDR